METARIALAPSRDLLSVPSSSTIARSRSSCVSNDRSEKESFKVPLTLAAAFLQPRPPYRFASPSRSSSTSAAPVEAPDGTEAAPTAPPSRSQTPSTAGRRARPATTAAAPVEAPDGTEADPTAPPSSSQTAFTVGRPRLSRISSPLRRDILGMPLQPSHEVLDQPWHTLRRVVYELEHRLLLAGGVLLGPGLEQVGS